MANTQDGQHRLFSMRWIIVMGWLYECFSAQALEYECLWMCDGESYEMTVAFTDGRKQKQKKKSKNQ